MMGEEKEVDLGAPWKESDLVLIVEGKPLHTHRLILSLNSIVFDKMLNSNFKEKNLKEIELPGKCYEEIKEMLEMLYDRRREIHERNVEYLLDISEEYQLFQLQTTCLDFLHKSDKYGEKAIKFIPILRRLGMKHLEEICLDNIKSIPFSQLLESDGYQNSSDETKLVITLARGQHLEGILRSQNATVESLLNQLYLSAHRTFVKQLTDKGYEESLLSSCERRDEHKTNKPGEIFDVTCSSCRRRVRTAKEFSVKERDVAELMERLFVSKQNI